MFMSLSQTCNRMAGLHATISWPDSNRVWIVCVFWHLICVCFPKSEIAVHLQRFLLNRAYILKESATSIRIPPYNRVPKYAHDSLSDKHVFYEQSPPPFLIARLSLSRRDFYQSSFDTVWVTHRSVYTGLLSAQTGKGSSCSLALTKG